MFVDTSSCVDLMRERRRGEHGPASRKLEELGDSPLRISLFALCELHAGARLSANPDIEIAKVERLSELIRVVCPERPFAVSYGETEALLRRQGTPIPVTDLQIGVMAKMHGMPLQTGDTKHFRSIPGLVIETY